MVDIYAHLQKLLGVYTCTHAGQVPSMAYFPQRGARVPIKSTLGTCTSDGNAEASTIRLVFRDVVGGSVVECKVEFT